ncbi:MAG: FkbM family methyltransferase [Planctomycetota bacterium]
MNYNLLQVPRHQSELRCAVAAKGRPAHLDSGHDAIARVLESCDVVVDPRDGSVAKHMLEVGFWEWWVTKSMADCMRPGTVCVDLGANAGYFGALFHSLGASAVISVEANPDLARRLRLTGERNGWQNFEVLECAVGDREGTAKLLVHAEDNLGGSCIVPEGTKHPGRQIEVPIRTLDQLLLDLAPIQVLKMDCEGSEPAIWRGMQGVLQRNPDMHIFAEVTVNHEAAPWLRQVEAQGYTLRYCEGDCTMPPLVIDRLGERDLWMAYFHKEQ